MSATKWNVDTLHSSATFEVQHMHISTYKGRFVGLGGSVVLDDENPGASSIDAFVEAKTFAAPQGKFYDVLMGEDFFQSDVHARLLFRSSELTRQDATHWAAHGALTIRGVEKPVTFELEDLGVANQPFNRVPMRAFKATAQIKRGDWGIVWNAQLDTGAAYLGETVTISLHIELLAA